MARLPRLDRPGIAQHIVQRGNDRQGCFADDANYLLTCYRYIELNPVRAGMVAKPADCRWSSHARNALGAHEPRITPHPLYPGLGTNDIERQRAYSQLLKAELRSNDLDDLRAHTNNRTPGAATASVNRSKP